MPDSLYLARSQIQSYNNPAIIGIPSIKIATEFLAKITNIYGYLIEAVMTFIDFKKALDSIHRGKMMRILKAYGIPPNLLQAIEMMYTNTKAKVLSPDGETEMFDITTGVLQGDTLAPFLFIIVLDYAMRKAMAGKEEELGFTITP